MTTHCVHPKPFLVPTLLSMGNFPLTQLTPQPQSTDALLLIAFLPFQHKFHGTEAHGEVILSGNSLLPTTHKTRLKGQSIFGKKHAN